MQTHLTKMQGRNRQTCAKIFAEVFMEPLYCTDARSIMKFDKPGGDKVWQFTGDMIDALLDDIKRMEALLTDLVQPEETEQA